MISITQITFLNQIGFREQLEDSIYPAPGKASGADRLFLVCDGVGGESKGEEASRIACEEFASYFNNHPPKNGQPTKEYIGKAQAYVLQKIRSYADQYPGAEKMSTTLTLAYIVDNEVFVAWCGDSRIYHLRNGDVLWHSTDHSLVANLVKYGEITEEMAKTHPQRNVITRSLSASGNPSDIDIHYLTDVRDGDHIMLCSDGILEQIDNDRLKKILVSTDYDKKSQFMEYCEGNTRDNFSLYLLEIQKDQAVAVKKGNKFIIPLLILIISLLLAIVFFGIPERKEPGGVNAKPTIKKSEKREIKTKAKYDEGNEDAELRGETSKTPSQAVPVDPVVTKDTVKRIATKVTAKPNKTKKAASPATVTSPATVAPPVNTDATPPDADTTKVKKSE